MGWNDPNYPPKRIPNWRPGNGAVQGMEGRELGEGEERASCWDRSPWQPPPSHLSGSEPSWVTSQRAAISCREAEGEKWRMASLPPNPLLQPTSLFSSYFEPFQCCPPSLPHLCPSLPQRLTHEETPRDRNGYLVDLSSSFSSASKPFFGYPGVDSRCAWFLK